MADPLSIAAGVVGVLTAAAQVSSCLINLTRAVKDAPQQARIIVTEVNDISGILSHLQAFLLGKQPSDRSRTSLLMVDQVMTIVSGCVLTFSELEQLLDELEVANLDIIDRMRWVRKESAIDELILRLQSHKASLSLMLNILNGSTMTDVKDSVDRLGALIQCCYQEMSSRVLASELRELSQVNVDISRSEDGAASLSTAMPHSRLNGNDALNWAEMARRGHEDGASSLLAGIRNQKIDIKSVQDISDFKNFSFTDDLEKSWVYSRNNAFRKPAFSASTSSKDCSRWSVFSGLSMAEVSNISVLNLPVDSAEVHNPLRSLQTWSNERSESLLSLPPLPFQLSSSPVIDAALEELIDRQLPPCKACGKPVGESKAFELAGNRWHVECIWRIKVPPRLTTSTLFTPPPNKAPDETSYPCLGCGEKMDADEAFQYGRAQRHRTCFYCDACGAGSNKGDVLLRLGDGSLICNNCTQDCSFDCGVCGNKLPQDRSILTDDKAFCPECFKCSACAQTIQDLKYGQTSQGIVCITCYISR